MAPWLLITEFRFWWDLPELRNSGFGLCQISGIPVSGGPYGPEKYDFDYKAKKTCLKGSVLPFLGTGVIFS
jgi:hypothetical protein